MTTALGIDVGGTKVALALVHTDGTILRRARIENGDAPDAAALLERVAAAAVQLAATGERPATVGVGICELIDRNGEIRSNTSIPWTRPQIVEALQPFAPVYLDADVRVAAHAEARVGAGCGFGSFVYVTIGTGVSCCLVCAGDPQPGARGFAQLIGSSQVTVPDRDRMITVAPEDVAAGPAIARRYAERTGERVSTEEVLRRGEAGDAAATAVAVEAATVLGSFVALLVNVLDPHAVVIGGGLGVAGGAYWDALASAIRERIWAEPARVLPIVRAELGADAGAVGAGLAALSRSSREDNDESSHGR